MSREEYYNKIEKEERPAAQRVAAWMTATLKPRSVVDFGCATGLYIEPFDCHVLGLELDEVAVKRAKTNVIQADLTKPLEIGYYDVGMSLEVAEHIPEDRVDGFLFNIGRVVVRWLVFSAAGMNQVDPLHVNLKPKQYWIDKLSKVGFDLHQQATAEMLAYIGAGYRMGWFMQNAFVALRRKGS